MPDEAMDVVDRILSDDSRAGEPRTDEAGSDGMLESVAGYVRDVADQVAAYAPNRETVAAVAHDVVRGPHHRRSTRAADYSGMSAPDPHRSTSTDERLEGGYSPFARNEGR